ncbi:MAG: hypothetical protein NTAFB01_07840 [Nitrospira sp.]
MLGDVREVLISSQERKTVLATGCGYQKIDGPGIDTFRAASSTKSRSRYIGRTSQLKQRVWIEKSQKMIELFCGAESIEKFLQNVTDQKYSISGFNMPPKGSDERMILIDPRPPQNQRPH